jgi:hypothetical protein
LDAVGFSTQKIANTHDIPGIPVRERGDELGRSSIYTCWLPNTRWLQDAPIATTVRTRHHRDAASGGKMTQTWKGQSSS